MEENVSERAEQRPGIAGIKPAWERLLLPLLGVLLIASVLWLGIQQNQSSRALSDQQRNLTLSTAADQQRETILSNYRDKIADLMVHDNLLHAHASDASIKK